MRGINFNESRNSWSVIIRIGFAGKIHKCGHYDTEEEAAFMKLACDQVYKSPNIWRKSDCYHYCQRKLLQSCQRYGTMTHLIEQPTFILTDRDLPNSPLPVENIIS